MSHRSPALHVAAGLVAMIVIVAVVLVASSANADTASYLPGAPPTLLLNYQGRLSDPVTGVAKPDGFYEMSFALFDVELGGSPLWKETRDVDVRGGLFSVRLGETEMFPAIFDGRSLWLEIKVGGDPQTSPRLPVTHVAYAIYSDRAGSAEMSSTADTATNALRLGGQPPSSYAAASHSHEAAAITAGTLSTDRFSAYSDLGAEGRIGESAGQLANGNHVHNGSAIIDGSLGTADLADGSVTSAKIADGNVTSADLAGNSVDGGKIVDLSVGTNDLANSAATAAKISPLGAGTNHVLYYTGSSVAWGYAPGSEIKFTVLPVNCASVASFTTAYVKIADIGAVSKLDGTSRLEVTFNGRISAYSVTSSGATFELRIDNAATTNGRARASVKDSEAGSAGVPVSITGIFTGLGAGTHTISMWVAASYGSGTYGGVDPGCWPTDHLVVREIK